MARFINPRPIFRVDSEVRGTLRRDVSWLRIEEDTSGLRTLQASLVAQAREELLNDDQVDYLDGQVLDFGREIGVALGAGGDARTVFQGRISALEAQLEEGQPARVNVFAEDALMDLRMTRRCHTYKDSSDQDVAEAIAGFHELEFEGTAPGPTYEALQQWNQSDLAFLRARARRVQAEVWIDNGTLHFASRDNRAAPELPQLVFGHRLIKFSARADLSELRSAVTVSGFDADAKDKTEVEATKDVLESEVAGGRLGLTILTQALGESASLRVRDVPTVREEAQAFAEAELKRRGRRFVCVSGVATGLPDMQVGCLLDLQRVGRAFEGGGYYTTRVCHVWNANDGHRTAFEAERAVLTEAS